MQTENCKQNGSDACVADELSEATTKLTITNEEFPFCKINHCKSCGRWEFGRDECCGQATELYQPETLREFSDTFSGENICANLSALQANLRLRENKAGPKLEKGVRLRSDTSCLGGDFSDPEEEEKPTSGTIFSNFEDEEEWCEERVERRQELLQEEIFNLQYKLLYLSEDIGKIELDRLQKYLFYLKGCWEGAEDDVYDLTEEEFTEKWLVKEKQAFLDGTKTCDIEDEEEDDEDRKYAFDRHFPVSEGWKDETKQARDIRV